jgi:hypothetical protein
VLRKAAAGEGLDIQLEALDVTDQAWVARGVAAAVEYLGPVKAASDPETPLHVRVGDDAELYVALWREAGTFDKRMETAMPVVEMTVGPRPLPS